MNDLISRSALLKRFKERCPGNCKKCIYSTFLASDEHCGLIDEAPTVEAIPRAKIDHIIERLEKMRVCDEDTLCNYCQRTWCKEELLDADEVMQIIKEEVG